MLTDQEFEALLADPTKRIERDISWRNDRLHRGAREFRATVRSESGQSLLVKGWWSPVSSRLSYSLVYDRRERIVGLDLGEELIHHNPGCNRRRRRTACACPRGTHKQRWTQDFGDRQAYSPADITGQWDEPLLVWQQFCAEINLSHLGTLEPPKDEDRA